MMFRQKNFMGSIQVNALNWNTDCERKAFWPETKKYVKSLYTDCLKYSKYLTCVNSFNPHNNFRNKYYYFPFLRKEDRKDQVKENLLPKK